MAILEQGLNLDRRGVEEIRLLLLGARQPSLVEIPRLAALAGEDQPPAVGAETDRAFLLGRVGDAPGVAEFRRGHEDLAAHDEGDLLAVGADGHLGGALGEGDGFDGGGPGIDGDLDGHLARLGAAGGKRIDLAVITEAQVARAADAEETHRVAVEFRDLRGLAGGGQRELPDVERAAALAQVKHRLLVGSPDRVAVLAGKVGELRVAAALHVVDPDVMRDRRLVVFAPEVLVALEVLVEQLVSGLVVTGGERRRGEDLHRAATLLDGDLVEFGHVLGLGKLHVGPRVHAVGEKHDGAAVRREGRRIFGIRVEGQAARRAAGRGDDKDIEVAVGVGGVGDILSVG